MRRTRALTGIIAATVLATGVMAAPAAALDDPELVVVHGIPGVRVDLCVNGKEVKRNFRYGQKFKPVVAGDTKIVLKPRRKGACKGRTIAKLTGFAGPSDQTTIVARLKKGKPALQILSEPVITAANGPAAILTSAIMGNATSFGTVDAWAAAGIDGAAPIPTFDGLKRMQAKSIFIGQQFINVVGWFTKPGKTTSLLLPAVQRLGPIGRVHFVLVGTKKSNLRVVKFETAFLLP